MTDCMVCHRPAAYDPKKGFVACSGCGNEYSTFPPAANACDCDPDQQGASNG